MFSRVIASLCARRGRGARPRAALDARVGGGTASTACVRSIGRGLGRTGQPHGARGACAACTPCVCAAAVRIAASQTEAASPQGCTAGHYHLARQAAAAGAAPPRWLRPRHPSRPQLRPRPEPPCSCQAHGDDGSPETYYRLRFKPPSRLEPPFFAAPQKRVFPFVFPRFTESRLVVEEGLDLLLDPVAHSLTVPGAPKRGCRQQESTGGMASTPNNNNLSLLRHDRLLKVWPHQSVDVLRRRGAVHLDDLQPRTRAV